MSELKLERISHPDAASTSIEIAASGAVSFSNDIAFDTNTFYVDTANGRVGIGTTSPSRDLHIAGNAAYVKFDDTTNGDTFSIGANSYGFIIYDDDAASYRMIIDSSGNVGIGATSKFRLTSQIALTMDDPDGSGIELGRNGASAGEIFTTSAGTVLSEFRALPLEFRTNNTEAMRIDSSGNLLVGTTTASPAGSDVKGVELNGSLGRIQVSRDSGPPAFFNRKTNDGDIAVFYKDGTTVGSIGSNGTGTVDFNGTSASTLSIGGTAQCVVQDGTFRPAADNDVDLGTISGNTRRFKNLYLSGGVYLGGTGAANYLDDYEEGTWTPGISGGIGSGFTYSEQYGYYTKVGNYVVAYFEIRIGTGTGDGNDFVLSGFPFTTSNTISGNGGFAGGFSINDLTRSGALIYINKNNTVATFRPNTGTSISTISTTDNLSSKYARGVVTYLTDA